MLRSRPSRLLQGLCEAHLEGPNTQELRYPIPTKYVLVFKGLWSIYPTGSLVGSGIWPQFHDSFGPEVCAQ